jgi:ABC-type sugar transport system substrate-binding protein
LRRLSFSKQGDVPAFPEKTIPERRMENMAKLTREGWVFQFVLAAIAILVVAATGCRKAEEETEGIRVVFQMDCQWLEENGRNEMASALTRFDKIDAVYGHNDPQAHGAYLAAKAEGRGREKTIKFIGIDALPHEGVMYVKQGVLTATLEYPTGGKEAIDLGMKILKGEEVPKWITLGTRLFTKENVDKAGLEIPAKGPKRAGLKPDKPSPSKRLAETKQVVVGMSQCNLAEPWRVQMNNDVRDQAGKYREIKLLEKDAQNDVTVQQSQVREFLTQGIDLLIVSPKETVPMTPPVKEVYDAGIPVIVLDREIQGTSFTCFIGGDNVLIGREAGKYIASILNRKGNVVELQGLMTSEPGVDRHEGFLQGLKDYAKEHEAEAGSEK